MVLEAIKYRRGKLEILDQLKLPHQEIYLDIKTPEEAWHAIKSMQVRGAPAIAIVAALSLAVWGAKFLNSEAESIELRLEKPIPQFISTNLKYLVTSRPTAVNLSEAANRLDSLVWATSKRLNSTDAQVIETYIQAAEQMLLNDVTDNENIGKYGADWILQNARPTDSTQRVSVLTHCNTGSLATAGYGTALGVIRTLHANGDLNHVFYTETRPYNQGSRLTGYELIHDKIPSTLVTDSMVAALLNLQGKPRNIVAVIVGADRVAANGDTANKIGTYPLAICARWHGIKFIVAAPLKTIDLNTKSGDDIVIEERASSEVTNIKGPATETLTDGSLKDHIHTISIAAEHTKAWNPAFDVTPATLIDAIVTEAGCVEKINGSYDMTFIFEPKS